MCGMDPRPLRTTIRIKRSAAPVLRVAQLRAVAFERVFIDRRVRSCETYKHPGWFVSRRHTAVPDLGGGKRSLRQRMDLTRQDAAQKCIKVMVYEATEMACQLLCHELERSPYGFEVAGYSTSSITEPNSPVYSADIALISADLHEGPNSGFKLLQDIRQSTDKVRCVMLLDRLNRDVVVGAFSSGALGICSRRESCETLCKCLDRVHHGQIWAN